MRTRGRAVPLSVVILTLLLAGFVQAQESCPPIPQKDFTGATAYKVVRVIDGDTAVLLMDGKETKVGLIGVDTPRTFQEPAEIYRVEASLFIENLLTGESVYVEYEPGLSNLDKYGRLLAYLFRAPDGLFVNLEIIRQGYGRVYAQYPFQYMELFRFYGRSAAVAEKGLWAPSKPDPVASNPIREPETLPLDSGNRDAKTPDEIINEQLEALEDMRREKLDEYDLKKEEIHTRHGQNWDEINRREGASGADFEREYRRYNRELQTLEKEWRAWLEVYNDEKDAIECGERLTSSPTGYPLIPDSSDGDEIWDEDEVTVYITETGGKYHRAGCRYLLKNKRAISLKNAKAGGYGPCPVCNPPR